MQMKFPGKTEKAAVVMLASLPNFLSSSDCHYPISWFAALFYLTCIIANPRASRVVQW